MTLHRVAWGIALACILAATASAQTSDHIIYKTGQIYPAEGSDQLVEVTKETYSVIKYDLTSRNVKIPQDMSTHKVAKVEYASIPFEYKEASDSFKNGYFEEALTAFKELAEKKPKPWVEQYALFNVGECLFNLGRIDEALEAYQELMRRVPDSRFVPDARYRIGECYLRKNDKVSAKAEFDGLKEYTTSKGYDPIFEYKAELGLIKILELDNNFTAALAGLDELQARVSQTFPEIANEAKLRIGQVYIQQQDFSRAESYFKMILDDAEGSGPQVLYGAYLGLGNCYYAQNRHKDALEVCYLRIAVANDKGQNVPLPILAEALFKAGRCWDQLREEKPEYANYAQDLYQEVIRVAPGSTFADQAQRMLRRH